MNGESPTCNIVTMPALLRVLLPFASTYRQLNLNAKWWHRLAIVCLCVVTALTFAASVAVPLLDEIDARRSATSSAYDTLATEARLPTGYTLDPKTGERVEAAPQQSGPSDIRSIQVPKSSLSDPYSGTAQHPDLVKQAVEATPIHGFTIVSLAVLITLVVSYAFQALYRAAIFVSFGKLSSAE